MQTTQQLRVGQVLTVTADAVSSGTVQRLTQPGDATSPYAVQAVAVSTSVVLGPFQAVRNYQIVTNNGNPLSYTIAAPDSDSATIASPTITGPTITDGTSTAKKVVTAIAASGAITIAEGIVVITKSSAIAVLTLAAPSAGQAGTVIQITSRTDKAHTITATSLINDGVTGGAKTTVTFAAFAGASITLVADNLLWNVLSLNACVIS
jgi:hypothetical protein